MRILISNDDGVFAPGIKALHDAMKDLGDVIVVAPDRDRSAASKSLTLNNPLYAREVENGFISVDGTPTDCVHLALRSFVKEKPDIVVTGINAGSNLGDDVMYSGTVAAATEGYIMGCPAVAFSLNDSESISYETAAQVAKTVVEYVIRKPYNMLLNVNIPAVELKDIKGIKTCRLGSRHQSEGIISMKDPRGRDIYWVGPSGEAQDAGEGTDFHAIFNNYVSITPLEMDLTNHNEMSKTKEWISELSF